MNKLFDRRTLDFLLFEVFHIDSICGHDRYRDYDRESLTAVLDLAEKISKEHLWSHAEKADIVEPSMEGEQVQVLPEVISASEMEL